MFFILLQCKCREKKGKLLQKVTSSQLLQKQSLRYTVKVCLEKKYTSTNTELDTAGYSHIFLVINNSDSLKDEIQLDKSIGQYTDKSGRNFIFI